MNIIFYILSQKLSRVGKILRGKKLAPKIVFAAFVLIFFLIGIAEFFGFLRAFRFLSGQEFFGPPLTLFVLEQFLLFVFVLFILSASISGFFIYFRSSDIPLLLSAPVGARTIFSLKFAEMTAISSWPLILLGIPLVLAIGMGTKAGVPFFIFAFFALAAFLFFSSALASLVIFFAGYFFKCVPKFLSVCASAAVLLGGGYGLVQVMVPRSATLSAIFEAANLESSVATTVFIEHMFFWWPSHWVALLIFSASFDMERAFFILSGLIVFAAVFSMLAFFVGSAAYPFLLLILRESIFYARGRMRGSRDDTRTRAGVRSFPKIFFHPAGAIVEKDILLFIRNYQELAKSGFILFLLFIYLAAIASTGDRIGRFVEAEGVVLALHLIAISYFVTTLSLQFVFPSVSLEGRGSWIVWSSPVNRKYVYIAKYFFWSALLFFVMEASMLFTAPFVGLSGFAAGVASVFLLLLVLIIVSVSLAFGTLFPDFHESNVDRLAPSAGGLMTTFTSLALGLFLGVMFFLVAGGAGDGPPPVFFLLVGGGVG